MKVAALSTSLIVSVPPVVSAALLSVRLPQPLVTTAASLVPRMLTVMLLVVPSALATVNVSV